MGAVADAGATKGVLGDAGTACDGERGGMADHGLYSETSAQGAGIFD